MNNTNTRQDIFLRKAAWDFILKNEIDSLPVDVFDLAKKLDYKVLTYDSLSKRIGKSKTYIKSNYNEEGFAFWSTIDKAYVICYDAEAENETIRWTLMHEIAHIVLGHITPISPILSRTRRISHPLIEAEADGLARRVLCPSIVLHECNAINADSIQKLCGISKTAAEYRAAYQRVLEQRNLFGWAKTELEVKALFRRFIATQRAFRFFEDFTDLMPRISRYSK